MYAYAIFDGGGVKGTAFGGCIEAIDSFNISIVGFGGTSAGSIAALLASAGYKGKEILDEFCKIDWKELFSDSGKFLADFKNLTTSIASGSTTKITYSLIKHRSLIKRIKKDLGIYDTKKIELAINKLISNKLPNMPPNPTFTEWERFGGKPLKIMASDVVGKQPHIYSRSTTPSVNISAAVAASISYPIIFAPSRDHRAYVVDGGISCNLPLSLFEEERRTNRYPLIAFDLESKPKENHEPYNFSRYCKDIITTAIDSTEKLLGDHINGVLHVRIPISSDIDTFSLEITPEIKQSLFDSSYRITTEFFNKKIPQWKQATTHIERIQAQHEQPVFVERALGTFVQELAQTTRLDNAIRAHIALPMDGESLVITYSHNMECDNDQDLQFRIGSGLPGKAFKERKPILANIHKENYADWDLPEKVKKHVREDRKAAASVPIFSKTTLLDSAENLDVIGTLSIDSCNDLAESRIDNSAIELMIHWANIFSKIIQK